MGGKGTLYVQFWSRLLERVDAEHPDWTRSQRAVPHSWIAMKAPVKGCKIGLVFAQRHRLRHELYIDTGDSDRNMELFSYLRDRQDQIEAAYGRPLAWEELPNRRACRISDYKDDCNIADEASYDEYIDWFLDAGTRLRRALSVVALPL